MNCRLNIFLILSSYLLLELVVLPLRTFVFTNTYAVSVAVSVVGNDFMHCGLALLGMEHIDSEYQYF